MRRHEPNRTQDAIARIEQGRIRCNLSRTEDDTMRHATNRGGQNTIRRKLKKLALVKASLVRNTGLSRSKPCLRKYSALFELIALTLELLELGVTMTAHGEERNLRALVTTRTSLTQCSYK